MLKIVSLKPSVRAVNQTQKMTQVTFTWTLPPVSEQRRPLLSFDNFGKSGPIFIVM